MFSSITDEELNRRARDAMVAPNTVSVRFGVVFWNGIPIPVSEENGEEKQEAIFKRMTVGDNRAIERIVRYEAEREDGKKVKTLDVIEYKRVMLRKNLLSWTLPIELERENDWLTDACYQRISNMSGALVDAIVGKYEDSIMIGTEEEAAIDRQAATLFGKHSRGVSDACEAVTLYCTLTSFWEKFGIGTGVSLDEMDYLDYQRLKVMSAKDAEASRHSASASSKPVTRIAGAGGRVRNSRGVSVG